MSDRIVILTKRPAKIKDIYNVNLEKKGLPTENRKDKKFSEFYDKIWRDLDEHV